MRLYVTGSSGFVGQQLAKAAQSWPSVELVSAPDVDILDQASLKSSLAHWRPDAILHLAAQSNVPASIADPTGTFQVNAQGTLNLLDAAAAEVPGCRLLYVGSSDQYGLVAPADLPISETRPLAPRNPYAASKAAGEMLVLERARRGRIDALCTRSFNHTGPGQDTRFVLPAIAAQLARIAKGLQDPVIITGDLDITRDFLDVRDVVQAYLRLLTHGQSGEVYNVCSGIETHLAQAASTMAALAGVAPRFERDPALLRPAEQRRVCGDNRKLRDLGWAPTIPLSSTLGNLIEISLKSLHKA